MRGTHAKRYSFFLPWAALAVSVGIVWLLGGRQAPQPVKPSPSPSAHNPVAAAPSPSPEPQNRALAGVWVPYMSLSTAEHTQAAFEANFKAIADSAKDKHFTALFVHVRAFCDALYPSELYPWSHLLTGQQGEDPGFDPLAFMVDYTHSLGMEFHAWINPLRVSTGETPAVLAADNPYTALKDEYPYYFMETNGALYLNPAYPYIRTLIAKGAGEIVEKYQVDGIHFDDYFYPSQEGPLDAEAYQLYAETVSSPLPLSQWRTGNISALVAEVYDRVKAANPDVKFGISPQGNLDNDRNMGADVEAWCAVPGYIDYICPQLYYGFENEALPYAQALSQWSDMYRCEGIELYVGLALYKAAGETEEAGWDAGDVISRQIREAQATECNGIVLYSSAFLDAEPARREVENAVAALSGGIVENAD